MEKELKELMIKIANYLGDNWVFNEIKTNSYKWEYYKITNSYKKELFITRKKGKLIIDLYILSQHLTEKLEFFHSINVSENKSPEKIAQDIKKRLFLNHEEKINENNEKRKEEQNKKNNKHYFNEALKKVMPYYKSGDNYSFDTSKIDNTRLEMQNIYHDTHIVKIDVKEHNVIDFICMVKAFLENHKTPL